MEILLAVAVVGVIAAVVGGVGILIGRRVATGMDHWMAGGDETAEGERVDDDQG